MSDVAIPTTSKWYRLRRLLALAPILVVAAAFYLLGELLEGDALAEVIAHLQDVPWSRFGVACAITALAYWALTGYDWTALRYVASDIGYRRSAPISLVAYGIGNSVGFQLFTSTPLRYRLYSALGLPGADVLRLIAFTFVGVWIGLFSLAAPLLLLTAGTLSRVTEMPALPLRLLGLCLLAIVCTYFFLVLSRRAPIRWRTWQFELPRARLALFQWVVAILDYVLTASVLWVFLPDIGPPFLLFLALYAVAQILAMLSHVPGGLGVFEASMVAFLAPWIDAPQVLGAALLFRLVYYVLPLLLAVVTIVVLERRSIRSAVVRVEERSAPWLGPVVPRLAALATFAAGAFLVVTGSIPSASGRLRLLTSVVPVELINTSHLIASVLGLGLLILSRGLARRLDGAWTATVWLLALALAMALLRGLDWEEALVLGTVIILLALSRRHFYRRASLLDRPFSPRWILAVGVVLLGGLWLGFLAYGNSDYSGEQLWRFSMRGDVPRFVRAQIALATGLLVLGGWRLFRGAPPPPPGPGTEEREKIERIVQQSPWTMACFARLGDKRFLLGRDDNSFLMYGVSGDSWISMGDPIVPSGDAEVISDLIWRFREQADLYDERPVFYQVRPENLPLYLEAGLSVIKLGEAGRTPLGEFSLQGKERRDMRQSINRAERENLRFEITPSTQTPELMPTLRQISDEWLKDKNASEKSFSLGCFREEYLEHFPMALVRRDEEILAFANVLTGADKRELSVDLMRYRTAAPPAVMDYLFVQVMLWGQAEGFEYFHLGMAPLSGLEQHALAPTWDRLGAWLFRNGEHFYNFKGLRAYKEKFTPVWEPRYLAAPDGLATSQALFDVARLISGGLRGLVTR